MSAIITKVMMSMTYINYCLNMCKYVYNFGLFVRYNPIITKTAHDEAFFTNGAEQFASIGLIFMITTKC